VDYSSSNSSNNKSYNDERCFSGMQSRAHGITDKGINRMLDSSCKKDYGYYYHDSIYDEVDEWHCQNDEC